MMASLFRKIADWLEPKSPPRIMHDLSEYDVAELKALRQSDEFALFLSVLDKEQTLVGEAMLASQDTIALHTMRGHILGIRNAGSIIDRILVAEEERNKNERRRSDNQQYADDPSRIALYGSPAWRPNT